MSLHPLLEQRFSARAYTGAAIPPEQLRDLMEAARWAPSSRNQQPWSFILAPRQDAAAFEALLSCLNERNQTWAKDAAVLVACCTEKDFPGHGPNRHAWHDIGLAVMAIAVQGVSQGLQLCEMGGIDADMVRARYHVPETHDITSGLAIGVAAVSKPEHERKALESFVFEGDWGKSFRF